MSVKMGWEKEAQAKLRMYVGVFFFTKKRSERIFFYKKNIEIIGSLK